MVWLVRAATDRNPPSLGGGGCQKYCQCQTADREEGPHPASRYGPFVRTGQPVSLGSVYGNARLRPASVLRGRAARTITLLSGIASGVLPAPSLLRSCPDGSS